MKILVYSWKDIRHYEAGGAEVNIHTHAENWTKLGHKVTIFTTRANDLPKREIINGVEVIREGNKYTVYIKAIFNYFLKFKREKYDVLIDIHNAGIPFFTPLFSRLPKVLYLHHIGYEQFLEDYRFPFNIGGYFISKFIVPIIYRKVPVVAVSESTKIDAIQKRVTSVPIEVIINGIDKCSFDGDKFERPTILFVGRLVKYKHIDQIIEAVKKLQKEISSIQLLIVGKGPQEENLKKLVTDLGLDYHVKFMGFVSEEMKWKLFTRTWVFASLSKREGWGLTVAESLASGTPVIVSDIPSYRELVQNNFNGLISNGNVSDLIQKCLLDPKFRAKLASKAKESVKNYSWVESSEKFLSKLVEVKYQGKLSKSQLLELQETSINLIK